MMPADIDHVIEARRYVYRCLADGWHILERRVRKKDGSSRWERIYLQESDLPSDIPPGSKAEFRRADGGSNSTRLTIHYADRTGPRPPRVVRRVGSRNAGRGGRSW